MAATGKASLTSARFSFSPRIVRWDVEPPLDFMCASLVRDTPEFSIEHYSAIHTGHAEAEADPGCRQQPRTGNHP